MTLAKSPTARDSAGLPVPLEAAADALCRSASEAARQHERVAKLNDRGAHHSEMQEATELRELAHRHVKARAQLYELSAARGKGEQSDAFWHAANTMWHAARDYGRRHAECDAATAKLTKHSSEKLGALALEYELEASALLGLKNAIAGYRKVRPDA
ncbi:MAG: hypothetical protein O2973_00545 [Gemmatimonadetes bacterium]|nr:hypothetical protein [Gemmatimonadota bacterium]